MAAPSPDGGIAGHRKRQEMGDLLSIHAAAASGDTKAIREQLKKWEG